MKSGTDTTDYPQPQLPLKEAQPSARSRAAKSALQQANTILTEQSRLQRIQSKRLYRTELFFALLSAGLAWNLWKTRESYNLCKERTQLELARLKQERDAVQFQLSNIGLSLENQLEPIADYLYDTRFQNTTQVRQKRKEALYKWLQSIFHQV
ncbi:hypothetical protein GpartN1_g1743.t1 [Galdieria partita]|uniref:Uncharacterized protein n=1 Tax=Galdieria partita TaxID=83374 RepID=A0A9C7UNY7_9RHOD|nr:hypothetical protein GpartN1_g1743.t1 [Galdieria partita]